MMNNTNKILINKTKEKDGHVKSPCITYNGPRLTFQQLYSERHKSTLSSGLLDTSDSWRFCQLYLHPNPVKKGDLTVIVFLEVLNYQIINHYTNQPDSTHLMFTALVRCWNQHS